MALTDMLQAKATEKNRVHQTNEVTVNHSAKK
jgi:hypothetical protein